MRQIFFILCVTILSLAPSTLVFAQTPNPAPNAQPAAAPIKYKSIVELPLPQGAGNINRDNISAEDMVKILYALSITLAALLAVVKIIYGGVQYMLTDVVTSKEKAKTDIRGAILGLVIVLSAVFILRLINPQLTTLKLFSGAPAVGTSQAAPPSGLAPANTPPQAPIPPVINNMENFNPQEAAPPSA